MNIPNTASTALILTDEQVIQVNAEREKISREPGNFVDWEDARKLLKQSNHNF